MTKTELLASLKSEVSNEEYQLMKLRRMPHLSISNRKVILDMMEHETASDDWIDDIKVEQLRSVTYEYLRKYLSEHQEGWRWVFLCCAYTAFILEVPMHPQEWVHYTTKLVDGKTEYYCPAKSNQMNTNCTFCVCKYVEEAEE